jgi:hypothetical protein
MTFKLNTDAHFLAGVTAAHIASSTSDATGWGRNPNLSNELFCCFWEGKALLYISIPVGVGIAILRYRLWDIDVLINRTLVYGSLTAVLALIYFGLVIGLQSLVHLVTGTISEQPLVSVASTLAIAALFQPLRRRIQAIIDRRFYRSKYDAAKTVAAFSATLRQEVDLEQLREQLLAVVQETMQPTFVSLWLRPPEQASNKQALLLPLQRGTNSS